MRFYVDGPGGIPGLQQASDARMKRNFTYEGNLTVLGTLSSGAEAVTSQIITAASANALAVGPNGTTNPTFNVDTSTASAATGLNVKSAAAAAGLAVSVLSSGGNENLTIDAKGSGTLILNSVATGAVILGSGAGPAVQLPQGTLAFGPAGAWSSIGGDSANLTVAHASGSTYLGRTGVDGTRVDHNGNLRVAGPGLTTAAFSAVGVNANAATVGPNGTTNPTFNVDTSTGSIATGLNVKGAAAAGGLAVTTLSSGTDENLTIAAKGAGTVTFNPAVTATAGGAANDGVKFGSIGVGVFTGTGAPSFSAMNGSIYVDSNATTTTTRIYVNKSGAGTAGTTWTNLTTAA